MKIVDAVLDIAQIHGTSKSLHYIWQLNTEIHIHDHSKSAGIVYDNAQTNATIVSKLRETIALAHRTDHIYQRASDDK